MAHNDQHIAYVVLATRLNQRTGRREIGLCDDKIHADLGQTRELVARYQAAEEGDARYSVGVIVPLSGPLGG